MRILQLLLLFFLITVPCVASYKTPIVAMVLDATCKVEASYYSASGVCIGNDGKNVWILTCQHVLDDNAAHKDGFLNPLAELLNGPQLLCVTATGIIMPALVWYKSEEDDLALLKCAPQPCPYLEFSNHEPQLGDEVLMAGEPQGFANFVSYGHVGGYQQQVGDVGPPNLVLDCPIAHGNSGGPVCDTSGRIVGIAECQWEGSSIAFAIPTSVVQKFLTSSHWK